MADNKKAEETAGTQNPPEPQKNLTGADSTPLVTENAIGDRQTPRPEERSAGQVQNDFMATEGASDINDGEAGKAEARAKVDPEKPQPPPAQQIVVDAAGLVEALGLNKAVVAAEPEPLTLGLDHYENGMIAKLHPDGENVNAWGDRVDDEGYIIEEDKPRRRTQPRRR